MWGEGNFQIVDYWKSRGFLFMQGKWKGCNNIVNIINVYSLCSLSEKGFLWEKILQLKRSIGDGLWCVLGDFIAITRKEKRLMRWE